MYRTTIYDTTGGVANYVISKKKKKNMPVEKYSVVSKNDPFIYFSSKDDIERMYKEELKNLRGFYEHWFFYTNSRRK